MRVVQSSRPCVCLLHHVEVVGRDRDGTEGSSLISAHFMPLILPVLLHCVDAEHWILTSTVSGIDLS